MVVDQLREYVQDQRKLERARKRLKIASKEHKKQSTIISDLSVKRNRSEELKHAIKNWNVLDRWMRKIDASPKLKGGGKTHGAPIDAALAELDAILGTKTPLSVFKNWSCGRTFVPEYVVKAIKGE
jgi:hypothetical protein